MAYDEHIADRIRSSLGRRKTDFEEKKMFGGLCFMVDDKMCLGVHTDRIMARINPLQESDALQRKGAKPMDFTGRPMKGYLFILAEGFDMDEDLEHWIQLCLDFNPLAKSSKKKKKK